MHEPGVPHKTVYLCTVAFTHEVKRVSCKKKKKKNSQKIAPAPIYNGHAFFANNSVIFGPILKIFVWLCSGDQELSIEYPVDHFWAKNKNAKFSAHIWAWMCGA